MPFFKLDIMKKLNGAWNPLLGCPLQAAMNKECIEAARMIFYKADQEMQVKIAAAGDKEGMIPLSVALVKNIPEFYKILISSRFDVHKADKNGRTPFMYACKVDLIEPMNDIFKLITLSHANLKDKDGCSALSYAAMNKNVKFCNFLFVNDIEVRKIKQDPHNIINTYVNLLDRYEHLCTLAHENTDEAFSVKLSCEREYDKACDEYQSLQSDIRSLESRADSLDPSSPYFSSQQSSIESEIRSIEKRMSKVHSDVSDAKERYQQACRIYEQYESREDELNDATRSDILYSLDSLALLAEKDCGSVKPKKKEDFNWGNAAMVAGLCLLGVL